MLRLGKPVEGIDFDVGCGSDMGKPRPRGISEEEYASSAPVWDETTRRFWCTTSLNAYDIPDGDEWKNLFRTTLERCTPEVAEKMRIDVDMDALTPTPLRHLNGQANSRLSLLRRPLVAVESTGNQYVPAKQVCASEQEPLTPPLTPTRRRNSKRLAYDDTILTPSPTPNPHWRVHRAAHTKALLRMGAPGVSVSVQGREIALYRFGGRLFAVAARCPHQGGKLCDGEIGDIEDLLDGARTHYVTCPVHKMQFDLASGAVLEGDCPPLQVYDARIGEVNEKEKVALVEIGFESLAAEYFAPCAHEPN